MTKKQFAIGTVIFIAGMIFSPKGGDSLATPQADTVAKSQMIELRDTDNKVFSLAASAMTACSDMLEGVQEGDIEKINSQADLLTSIADSVNTVKVERNAILIQANIPTE